MDLVKDKPKDFHMPNAVPPIKKECSDKLADEALEHGVFKGGQMEKRRAKKKLDPKPVGPEGNNGLHYVDQNCAAIPSRRMRQLAARHDAL